MWMKDRIWIETRGEPYYNLIVSKSLDWKLGEDGHTRGDRHTEGTDITITNSDF